MAETNAPRSGSPKAELDLGAARDRIPPVLQETAAKLNLRLSPDDGMYADDDAHYLSCGASALNIILAGLQLANAPAPQAILDFGAGAGRVTRWLRAAYPSARLAACDLRPQDVQFCREQFGAETWISGIDIAALTAPGRYDLIWVGSVLTHLSAKNSGRLIDKLLSWLNPRGLLVMSIIGRTLRALDESGAPFIHAQGWAQITQQYGEIGYGYADYAHESGYGLSLTKLSWAGGLAERMPGTRLVALSEGVWDNSHDVLAIQKLGDAAAAAGRSSAEAAVKALSNQAEALQRGAAIEASTLWRATAPIRSAAKIFGR